MAEKKQKGSSPAPKPQTYKVKYIGGSGTELAYPLSNGMTSIVGNQVIVLTNYQDYVRLIGTPDFVEVRDTPTPESESVN